MTAPIIIILAIDATLAWVVPRISTIQVHRSPATQICQALETIHTLEHTHKYEPFLSQLALLEKLSTDINATPNDKLYKQHIETAVAQYKKIHKTSSITRHQKEFLGNPNLADNHNLTAKLKTRFFLSFCDYMGEEIGKHKDITAQELLKKRVKEVALSLVKDLEATDHIALAQTIIGESQKLGITISNTSV